MVMTFEEYDQLLEDFDAINTKTFWPTLEQIDHFAKEPEKWIKFCCYLYEKGKTPANNTEKYSKKNLSLFINKYLELIDSEDIAN